MSRTQCGGDDIAHGHPATNASQKHRKSKVSQTPLYHKSKPSTTPLPASQGRFGTVPPQRPNSGENRSRLTQWHAPNDPETKYFQIGTQNPCIFFSRVKLGHGIGMRGDSPPLPPNGDWIFGSAETRPIACLALISRASAWGVWLAHGENAAQPVRCT